ncbi:CRISPR-associated helicase/endonuclease Cas3 [Jannaschia pagri]|uniref:CRISPR-associated helicase/endonuclease Cas3 n=1 Tax=Jannaschia pagri TaxID=2829797 RepID=A0ABQ4NRN7_9RHOB|nr:CRISPR-associated helicase/endonuclease Cas3 [Jannaschia sp. AI_61]GIT97086.1 CRISPR-associated helicase/endonuclease Cas3 [Jannaschia sp. AI_62]
MTQGPSCWGKTDEMGRPSHHLAHHSMDVAAVLEMLLAHPILSKRVAAAAGAPLGSRATGWLAAFAFLHDIGKLSPSFQAKAWPSDIARGTRSHLSEGLIWADRLLDGQPLLDGVAAPLIEPLIKTETEEAWFGALFAHHGRPLPFNDVVPPHDPRVVFPDAPGYDWRAEDRRMGEALRLWFPEIAIPADALRSSRLVHLFAGLLALADWIGSDAQAFPHVLDFDPDYGATARGRAARALYSVGVSAPPWPTSQPSFAALTGHPEPQGVQKAIADVPSSANLVIVEAETGSGKTEAALAHFAQLRSAGRVDALYFAVPTRAAAGQLHRRVHKAMSRVGGPDAVLAVPGMLRAGEAEGKKLPGFRVLWDDDRNHWAAEHPSRFLAAAIAVGTIDQALLAGLRIKHAPLRAAALTRSLLVIDEVHASDAYMNAIARPLVAEHVALGGHALPMSATLGSGQRAAWLGQDTPTREAAEAAPYPTIWHDAARSEPLCPDADTRRKTVHPIPVPTMDPAEAARRAIEAAACGARVLVIRNTVDSAVETWQHVTAAQPDLCLTVAGRPTLHHARFAAEDRHALDAAVENALGRGATESGVVVIGTQTLEQSLDIDADVLITDLCPMDVLLQRVGRLHRHVDRVRPPGFEAAYVQVMVPEGGLAPLAIGPRYENGLGAWRVAGGYGGIYLDLRVLELTRRCVTGETPWRIPSDNRHLVETATHPDALSEVETEMGWSEYGIQIDAKALAEGRAGGLVTLDRAKPFPSTFPDVDETVQTRLGARGPNFALPNGTVGPFGTPISTIAPPAHWCLGLSGDEPVEVSNFGTALRFVIKDKAFLYQDSGLSELKDPF